LLMQVSACASRRSIDRAISGALSNFLQPEHNTKFCRSYCLEKDAGAD
jgi:hypothetical protein